jgi:hypothetical protein
MAPEKMEMARLRAELLALQQQNADLRRQVTPDTRLERRSPPPTEKIKRPVALPVPQPAFPDLQVEDSGEDAELITHQARLQRAHLTAADPVPTAANWRPRGDHPTKKLSGSTPSDFPPVAFPS